MGLENILDNLNRFNRRLIVSTLLGCSLLSGCSGGSDKGPGPTGPSTPTTPTTPTTPSTPTTPPSTPTAQPQTYVLTTNEISNIPTISPSNIIFSSPVNYSVGDIIVSGISNKTPEGFLREVSSLSSDKKTVFTSQATLEQTVQSAYLSFYKSLSPSSVISTSSLEGVSLLSPMFQTSSYKFGVNLNNVLFDKDGNPNTTGDQVVLNGKISFSPDFSLDFEIENKKLQRVDFGLYVNQDANVTVGSNMMGLASSTKIKIIEYLFQPILLGFIPAIVPIPIIATPKLGIYAELEPANLNPLSFRIEQSSLLNASLTYKSGLWSKTSSFVEDFDFSVQTPAAGTTLKAKVGPKLEVSLYGILAPNAEANAKLKFESQSSSWNLYGGLEASLGIDLKIFGKNLSPNFEKVFETEKLLKQGVFGTTVTPSQSRTDTLYAGKDAFVEWSNLGPTLPNTNYNTSTLELLLDSGRREKQLLIQFPLSSSITGKTIESAKLVFSGYCVGNIIGNVNSTVKKITSDWNESIVTWNSRPSYMSSSVGSLSAMNSGTVRNHEILINALAQEWASGVSPNYGMTMILSTNEGVCSFASKEHADASRKPKLIVVYH
jgi:hypothetical protein